MVVEEVMMPFPWDSKGKVVVIMHEDKAWVPMIAFQALALQDNSPLPMSIDVLKAKLTKVHATTLKVDANNPPGMLGLCKSKGALPPRVARAKLVTLESMKEALIYHGWRADHVAILVSMHKRMLDTAAARAREEEQGG